MPKCNFGHAKFETELIVEESNLERSSFEHVIFAKKVSFNKTGNHHGVSFKHASFKDECDVEFDYNNLQLTSFDKRRNDNWYALSGSFSGIAQVINILLVGIYFATLVLKVYLFESLSKLNQRLLPNDTFSGEQISAFEFVFGNDELSITLVLVAITYQSLRYFITVKVSPLIEMQKQTGYTPDLDHYSHLLLLSFFMKNLCWLFLVFFLLEMADILLTSKVSIPI